MREIHTFDEAAAQCQAYAKPPVAEQLSTEKALGRTLFEDARARVAMPPFHRAMMDGFAVRGQDLSQFNTLKVKGSVAAGAVFDGKLEPGWAVRIMTGAPLPDGADTVVRWEWCEAEAGNEIRILKPVKHGESVQPQGEDAAAGAVLVPAGRRLSAAELSVCRSFGVAQVVVTKPPKVAILVTGSELVQDPEQPLLPGQIYGANDTLLAGALTDDGADVVQIVYLSDDLDAISGAIGALVDQVDFILMTGGVSTGDFDFVPAAVKRHTNDVAIEHVWLRPGSPFVLARLGSENTVVFALSGNPAACAVQFETLVRPAIRKTLGRVDEGFPATGILSYEVVQKPVKHTRILRACATVVDGQIRVDARTSQSPGVLSSFAQANCLVRLDGDDFPAGTVVPLRWLRQL